MSRICFVAVAVTLAIGRVAFAQGHAHAQGDTSEKLGSVHFRTSCGPEVAPQFDRAISLLHSFEFGASIRAFNEVLARDSTCAMAYWGIALSRWTNPFAVIIRTPEQLKPGGEAIENARRLGNRATERERAYIAAVATLYDGMATVDQRTRVLAYERAMADLAARQPADTEAMIFHALSLAASALPTDKTYANQLKAGSILEPIWAVQPNHPGLAHYIIHSYDYPPLADRARAASARYAAIAPSAAHALHMPSHTFTRVGMWQESITTNLRSIQVAQGSGAIGEALHASDYAMYAYLQLRRDTAAKAVLEGLPNLAARFDVNAVTGAAPGSAGVFALAAIPARWVLERRAWAEAAKLEPAASAFQYTEAMTYFARALGAAHTGDLAKARASRDSLTAIRDRLAASRDSYWAEQVAIQQLGAQAWIDLAERHSDAALAHMREAAQREDATEKSAVTPGPLAPARELLGDLLMAVNEPRAALAEYRATLRKEPNRYWTLHGAMTAASAAGDRGAAADYAAQLQKIVAH